MAKKYWGYFTQIAFLAFFSSPHVAKKGIHTFFCRQGVFCIPHQCSTDNLMTHSFRYCEIRNKITRSKPIQVERSSCFYPNKYTCTRSSKLLHCASKSRVLFEIRETPGTSGQLERNNGKRRARNNWRYSSLKYRKIAHTTRQLSKI